MPYKSAKQKRTMLAAAHNPKFAKRMGIKQSAAKKFVAHSKGKKKGGRKR